MPVNLDGFSQKELKSLISKAAQRVEMLESRTPAAEVRRMLAALAKEHSYTLDELFGDVPRAAGVTKGSKVAAKYRHPSSGQTWSGRGKPPKWLAAEIANGKKPADFAI